MYYVYAIQSEKNKIVYIGYTNDLRRRLKLHKSKNLGGLAAKIQFRKRFERNYKLVYPPKFKEI